MIRRLRPLPQPEELARLYPAPHDHRRYGEDHAARVETTIELAKRTLGPWYRDTIADLSAGNGAIAHALALDDSVLHLGDVAGRVDGADVDYLGPIEQTIRDLPHVDLFICSETLEHLDASADVLVEIRKRADRLLLSTPINAWDDTNPEHLWAWSKDGVERMLVDAGWLPVTYGEVDGTVFPGGPYVFGIWVCK